MVISTVNHIYLLCVMADPVAKKDAETATMNNSPFIFCWIDFEKETDEILEIRKSHII